MTTYAPHAADPAAVDYPDRSQPLGKRPASQRRRRSAVLVPSALLVLAVAIGAAVYAGAALGNAQPTTRRTAIIVPPRSVAYPPETSREAGSNACDSWDSAADAMAQAANATAKTPIGWDNPSRVAARQHEVRVILTEIFVTRSKLDPATPPQIRAAIERYFAQTIAIEDAAAHHQGRTEDSLIRGQNNLVSQVNSACGFK